MPSPTTILDLPHELILIVFESLQSLSDLGALINTAPIFNNVWRTSTASISTAILPTAIECYPQAFSLEQGLHPEVPVGFEMSLQRHSRIVKAACCANEVWDLFLLDFDLAILHYPASSKPQHLTDHRQDFKSMFYYIWGVVGASTYKPFKLPADLCSNLHRLPRRYILALCEVIVWLAEKVLTKFKTTISKMRHIHSPCDHVRYSYQDRWIVCCEALWRSDFFTKLHIDYFVQDLQVAPLRPPYGRLYHSCNFFAYRGPLLFARREFCRLYC